MAQLTPYQILVPFTVMQAGKNAQRQANTPYHVAKTKKLIIKKILTVFLKHSFKAYASAFCSSFLFFGREV